MLNNFRIGANSFIIRLLLAMVAFAFVGWGIKDVLQVRNNYDLVTFDKAKNISENDFLKAKSEEISMLQKQGGTNLSEEDIKQLNLDKVILQRLINDNILNYITSYYNLDLSEEAVIYFVKQSPIFKNEQGEFDSSLLKSFFRNSNLQEKEYLQNIKEKMLKNIIISTFLESFKTPEIMIKNIVNYMAERRFIDLVEIDLKKPSKNIDLPAPTEKDVDEFYQNHKELFTTPEKRDFSYVIAKPDSVTTKIIITDQELLDFYNENKEEFDNKNFDKVKKQVLATLKQQKTDELMLEFAKNLEDDVAAGSTLKEIVEKYELQLVDVKDVTYEDIADEKAEINIAADAIFEMSEGEVLYPVELKDKKGMLLVELLAIKPSKLQEFNEVKEKAVALLNEKLIENANLKTFEKIANDYKTIYKPNLENLKNLHSLGIKIDSQFSVTRSELEDNDKLPQGLLIAIFNIQEGSTTQIFNFKDKAYFAYVKQVKIDEDKAKNIKRNEGESIATTIRNGVIEELIGHFIKKNKMKINFKERVAE